MENIIIITLLFSLILIVCFVWFNLNLKLNSKFDNNDNSQILVDDIKNKLTNLDSSFSDTRKEISKDITKSLTEVEQKIGFFNTEINKISATQQDFTKILSGVKQFGGLAEFTLGSLLSDLLPASQYTENYKPNPETRDVVEFGIKLQNEVVCCVDSHWPIEKYKAVDTAFSNKDKQGLADAKAELAKAFKKKASDVSLKYIIPPRTTDFAIVYVPTEGLYSELAKYQDPSTKVLLIQELMKKYKVTLMGPNNLSAYLQALHMGFQTLKVQKHATEVHEALKQITNRFSIHFEGIAKLRKKLDEAMQQTDDFGRDARSIKRTLENLKDPEVADNSENVEKLKIKSSS